MFSGTLIYAKDIAFYKFSTMSVKDIKEGFNSFYIERIKQFKETYMLSIFFILNNLFGVKGLSQVSIPMYEYIRFYDIRDFLNYLDFWL